MTGPAPITVGHGQPISFRLDPKPLEYGFDVAPGATYYWLRSALRGVLIDHRRKWLGLKGTKFGRGDDKSRAIKVWQIDEAPAGVPQDNWVVFEVHPRERRIADPNAARAALTGLVAQVHAGSIALQVHQEGTDIRSRSWMTIPVRTRPGNPKAWREKNPGKELVLRPSKRDSGTMLLFERQQVRGRGRPRKDGTGNTVGERLRLRFLLKRHVDMKPTLRFYESWDAANPERSRQLAYAADRILKDIARGKLS